MKVCTMSRIEEDLDVLASFSSTDVGVTRLPFTVESEKTIEYIRRRMMELGLEVELDAAGNLLGTLKGNQNKGEVYIGSHYDTVVNAGKYDGLLGIAMGLELIHQMKTNGYEPEHDIVLLATNDEEGIRFGNGYFGSRAIVGDIEVPELHKCKDDIGTSIYEVMKNTGYEPEDIKKAAKDLKQIKSFVEFHIEQGPVLDSEEIEIGIVEGIVGILRCVVTIRGEANHAGTTPIHLRKDALVSASEIVLSLQRYVKREGKGSVATVGYMNVQPNVINVIAGEVTMGIDIRSQENESIEAIYKHLICELLTLESNVGIKYSVEEKLSVKPVALNSDLIQIGENSCRENDISYKKMYSGAGHDALVWASKVPTIMLFVPSIDGISHRHDEYTKAEDIALAVDVAYDMIKKIDRRH